MFILRFRCLLFFGIVLVFSASGCAKALPSANTDNDRQDKIRLVFWDENAGLNRTPFYQELFRIFEAENPEIEVAYVGIPQNLNKMKLDVAISSNNMPDLAGINAFWIADLASKGVLLPLDDYFDEWNENSQISSPYIEYNRSLVPDHRLYHIPNTLFYLNMFWYRKDWFAEAGLAPLQTWDDFFSAVQVLTDSAKKRYGYSIRGGEGSINQLTAMLYAYSGIEDYFDAAGKCTVNNPKHVEFLKRYVALYQNFTPKEDIAKGYKELVATFDSGASAIIQHNFGSYHDHLNTLGENKFDAVLLPKAVNGKRIVTPVANGYSIFKSSKHPEGAWKLLRFLLSEKSQSYWNQNIGQMPTRLDAYKSDFFQNESYIQNTLNALKDNQTVVLNLPFYLPNFSNIMSQQLEPNFQDVLAGTMSAEEFLNGWADSMNQSYAEYGKE